MGCGQVACKLRSPGGLVCWVEGGRGLPRVVAPGGIGASGPYRSHARGGCRDSAGAPFYYLPPGPSGALWQQHSTASVLGIEGAVAAAGQALRLTFHMQLPTLSTVGVSF